MSNTAQGSSLALSPQFAQRHPRVENNLTNQETKITERTYDIGRQNDEMALAGEEELPGKMFNPATAAARPALRADEQTDTEANENTARPVKRSRGWFG